MMRKEDCFFLGRILKKYSFKGEIIVGIPSDFSFEMFEDLDTIFLEIGNRILPFCVEKISNYKDGIRLVLEKIKNEKDADLLVGKKVFLPWSFLPQRNENQFYYQEIIDFNIVDLNEGFVGKVIAVNESNRQHLFEVKNEHKKKTILIPIVEKLILKVDKTEKKITVKLPKGLLDL